MQPWLYVVTAIVVLAVIIVVFRLVVRGSYRRHRKLSGLASTAQYVAILSWVAFGCANLPRRWPAVHVGAVQEAVGWLLFVGGWGLFLLSFLRLGVRRSHGLQVAGLRQTGPYGLSRNPQATAFLVAMVGYFVLWPTWRNLGVLVLVVVLSHLMIRTEEEHLRDVFGSEYDDYLQRVRRYLGRRRGRPSE